MGWRRTPWRHRLEWGCRDGASGIEAGEREISVADPAGAKRKWNEGNALGVESWKEAASTIGAGSMPGRGYSVTDPRITRNSRDAA